VAGPEVRVDVRVISLGALAAHRLRGERGSARTGHATTTLVRAGGATILVDPGLPAPALVARLDERAGIGPDDVTHVFLTSFQPDTTRGLRAFSHARWLISAVEREAVGVPLATRLRDLADDGEDADEEMVTMLEREVGALQKCEAAPDAVADGVDLFPLPGVTPGMTGLLISETSSTTLVAGDAVATIEHLREGKVLQSAVDVETAKDSFKEAVEIADYLVLGRDNLVANPLRRPF